MDALNDDTIYAARVAFEDGNTGEMIRSEVLVIPQKHMADRWLVQWPKGCRVVDTRGAHMLLDQLNQYLGCPICGVSLVQLMERLEQEAPPDGGPWI